MKVSRVFKVGSVLLILSLVVLVFPIMDEGKPIEDVNSISELFSTCGGNMYEVQTAWLLHKGYCAPSIIVGSVLWMTVVSGIVLLFVWFVRCIVRIVKKWNKLTEE